MGSLVCKDATHIAVVRCGRCELREDISGLPRGDRDRRMLAPSQVLPPCQDLEGKAPKAGWGTVGLTGFRELQMRVQGTPTPLQVYEQRRVSSGVQIGKKAKIAKMMVNVQKRLN